MAVVKNFGTERAKVETTTAGFSDHRLHGKAMQVLADTVAFAVGDSIGSTGFFGRLASNSVILPSSQFFFGAFGTAVTLDIGDVNDPNGLATVVAIAAVGSAFILEAVAEDKLLDPLWKQLGYATDPAKLLDLYCTVQGAAVGAAKSLSFEIHWV